jgi:hypothetical protein
MKTARHPLAIALLVLLTGAIVAGILLGPGWQRARTERHRAAANTVVAVTQTTGTNAPAQAKAAVIPDLEIDRSQAQSRMNSWVDAPVRDPFQVYEAVRETQRTNVVERPTQSLTLSGIWRQSGGDFVVINGRVCGLGDHIEGFKVVQIEADRVWIQGPKGKEELLFGQRPSTATRTNAPTAGQHKP